MSNPTNVGDNPNDKMPAGNPLPPDQVVPEGDGGDTDDHPPQNEHDELIVENDGLAPPDEDEDQPGLPGEPAIEKSNTLQKP